MKKILVAGIGNIFFGDDAFGCEVVKLLQKDKLTDSIKIVDFGINIRDLAYELCENYDVIILIDAVQLGNSVGTVSLIELNPHDFTAQSFFRFARSKIGRNFGVCQNFRCKV